MTDLPFRKILGLNQQTYQRLRIALSLNLRRQVFVAVCDDLVLRDRLATQLADDLTPTKPQAKQSKPDSGTLQRYPRLVSLHLNLDDPNPIAQAAEWLSQPSSKGSRRAMPAFQILGIEQLTRQPAATQRLFLTYLQDLERSLPTLESSLLFWLPKPWFHALPQSAPEFWRCRTAVFEFVGDPTPLPPPESDSPIHIPSRQPDPNPNEPPLTPPAAEPVPPDVPADDRPSDPSAAPKEDLWSILARDLAKLDHSGDSHNGDDSTHSDNGTDNGDARFRNGATQIPAKPVQVIGTIPQVAIKAKLTPPSPVTTNGNGSQPLATAGTVAQAAQATQTTVLQPQPKPTVKVPQQPTKALFDQTAIGNGSALLL
ncbi:MAG TPA: hypothetical protein V6C78_24755, partial [Crinalium sp.]